MRRGTVILGLGLVGAVIAYACVYLLGTATPRALKQSVQPELAWLRHEFNLGESEFSRISELHARYLPQCQERCRRIEELNASLSRSLAAATNLTPEIEKLLGERAQMRARCQAEMLTHFFEVSRTMPPEQGLRYLEWARANTCLRDEAMSHGPGQAAAKGHPMPATHP